MTTHPRQHQAWSKIPKHVRHTTLDGVRMVLVATEHGTTLVPWLGLTS